MQRAITPWLTCPARMRYHLLLVLFGLFSPPLFAQSGFPEVPRLLLEQRENSARQRKISGERPLIIYTDTDTLRGVRFSGMAGESALFLDSDSLLTKIDLRLDEIHRMDAVWFQPGVQRFVISGFGSVLAGAALAVPYAGLLWAIESKESAMDALKVGGILLVIGLPPIYLVTRKTRLDTRNKWRVAGQAF